jgi:AraC-like DNA-binding protein
MIYVPTLKPLLENSENIYTEITYNNEFTKVDDITKDEEHIHDFYEIYINLCGDVSFLVEHDVYSVSRGDIIVTAPNEIHRCIYHSNCMHEHFCIWIKDLPFATDKQMDRFCKNKLIVLSDENKSRVIDACFALYKERASHTPTSFGAIKSFFEILDIISAPSEDVAAAQSLPSSFSDIVEYISGHYTEPSCTVTLLCDNFYISKSTLCRRFRRYFQTTPSDYIEAKRFAEAKRLLSAGQSVQNACLNSGFSDCSYFIMRFRKKFGITPYRYQKEFM